LIELVMPAVQQEGVAGTEKARLLLKIGIEVGKLTAFGAVEGQIQGDHRGLDIAPLAGRRPGVTGLLPERLALSMGSLPGSLSDNPRISL
jgi:hypothetical protein